MSEIKRINLSFRMDRESDKKVYDLLNGLERNMKTAFVIDAVLAEENRNSTLDEQTIKKALREVLIEMNISLISQSKSENDTEIPDVVFDVFGKL